jgi:hypothetical protein
VDEIKSKSNFCFFVCEALKKAEEVKDLPLGLLENVLPTSSEFMRLPNGFYGLTSDNSSGT